MTITQAQIDHLRQTFGDPEGKVFTPGELDAIWTEVAGAADERTRRRAALYLMCEQCLNSAARLHDYTAGATGEKLSQVYDHFKDRCAAYASDYEAATSTRRTTVRRMKVRPAAREGRETPNA